MNIFNPHPYFNVNYRNFVKDFAIRFLILFAIFYCVIFLFNDNKGLWLVTTAALVLSAGFTIYKFVQGYIYVNKLQIQDDKIGEEMHKYEMNKKIYRNILIVSSLDNIEHLLNEFNFVRSLTDLPWAPVKLYQSEINQNRLFLVDLPGTENMPKKPKHDKESHIEKVLYQVFNIYSPSIVLHVGMATGIAGKGVALGDLFYIENPIYRSINIEPKKIGETIGTWEAQPTILPIKDKIVSLKNGQLISYDGLNEKALKYFECCNRVISYDLEDKESFSIGHSCRGLKIPFVVIKGINKLLWSMERTEEISEDVELIRNLTNTVKELLEYISSVRRCDVTLEQRIEMERILDYNYEHIKTS